MAKVQVPKLDLRPTRNQTRSGELKHDAEGWWLAGQFLGRRVLPSVFAEEIQEGRHLMRSASVKRDSASRLGEVFGEGGHYTLCDMHGEQLGRAKSLREAAEKLVAHNAGSNQRTSGALKPTEMGS